MGEEHMSKNRMGEYELKLMGVLKTRDDAHISEAVEVYYESEEGDSGWITLVTDVSASKDKMVKVMVDGFTREDFPVLEFDSYEELCEIKAVRFSVIVPDKKNGIMHIIRKTVHTEFERDVFRSYMVGAILKLPCIRLEDETREEMILKAVSEIRKSDECLFFEFTKDEYAELDEIENSELKKKTYIPYEKAKELLNDQFPGIVTYMKQETIRGWNYTDLRKHHKCFPVEDPMREGMQIKLL